MWAKNKNVNIKIKNFKSLENISLDLKPLTLVLGPNSSGKSSFLKALKFLDKNLFPLKTEELTYCLDGNTDLGSYRDIVTGNNTTDNILFEINISGVEGTNQYGETLEETIDDYLASVSHNISESLDEIGNDAADILCHKRNYHTKGFGTTIFLRELNKQSSKNILGNRISEIIDEDRRFVKDWNICEMPLQVINEFEGVNGGRLKKLSIIDKHHGFGYEIFPESKSITTTVFPKDEAINDLVQNFFDNALVNLSVCPFDHVDKNEFISYLFNYFLHCKNKKWKSLPLNTKSEIIKRIMIFYFSIFINIPSIIYKELSFFHLPTIRQIPQRLFLKQNNRITEDYYGLLKDLTSTNSDKIKIFLSDELKNFNFASGIDIIEDSNTVSLIYKAAEGTCENNLSEASSGLIQFLPILYRVFKNNRLLIEQPELHLHPKLQSNLANFFVRIGSFEDKCLIIETHSEHLIRKLQVLIAKKKVSTDQLVLYYFNKRKGKTKIKRMEIEDTGFLKTEWPSGFYDNGYELSKELIFSQGIQ